MPPQRDIQLQPYSDDRRTRHHGKYWKHFQRKIQLILLSHAGVSGREDWIEMALGSIEYEFSMLQLERNNLASMLQFYGRDKTHVEDCIQHVKETARQRNERLTQEIEELMAKLASK